MQAAALNPYFSTFDSADLPWMMGCGPYTTLTGDLPCQDAVDRVLLSCDCWVSADTGERKVIWKRV